MSERNYWLRLGFFLMSGNKSKTEKFVAKLNSFIKKLSSNQEFPLEEIDGIFKDLRINGFEHLHRHVMKTRFGTDDCRKLTPEQRQDHMSHMVKLHQTLFQNIADQTKLSPMLRERDNINHPSPITE